MSKSAMFSSSGLCACANTRVSISLPLPLEQLSPRKCDCNYCVAKNVAYLSCPGGLLEIASAAPLEIQRQGSGQAMFLACSTCGTVIAVTYQLQSGLIGALNSSVLANSSKLAEPIVVSPKLLAPEEKVARWQSLWLSVKHNEAAPPSPGE